MQIFSGAPAKFLRNLTEAEILSLSRVTKAFTELAWKHGQETSKVLFNYRTAPFQVHVHVNNWQLPCAVLSHVPLPRPFLPPSPPLRSLPPSLRQYVCPPVTPSQSVRLSVRLSVCPVPPSLSRSLGPPPFIYLHPRLVADTCPAPSRLGPCC